ncbi:MAG: hypothetical protein ACK559_09285, partial [bacterium]
LRPAPPRLAARGPRGRSHPRPSRSARLARSRASALRSSRSTASVAIVRRAAWRIVSAAAALR